jgi:hypothetical protein
MGEIYDTQQIIYPRSIYKKQITPAHTNERGL